MCMAVYGLSVQFVLAAGTSGLVDGLWFSDDPVSDFNETTVHAVIHNQSDTSLQGIATLTVDGEAVGADEITVSKGSIQQVSIKHKFTTGTHRVGMSFTAGNGTEVTLTQLPTRTIFVIQDTDGDGIQNTTDTDDDNDGIPDTEDDEPLVKQVLPKPSIDLSNSGRALLGTLTNRFSDSGAVETSATTTNDTVGTFTTIFTSLEEARKRGAEAAREYEEERRLALEEIARVESELPAVEGFESSRADESKKREHQIAAAGASVTGTVLEHGFLFYAHILILVLSVVHVCWGWFKSRFRPAEVEYEE